MKEFQTLGKSPGDNGAFWDQQEWKVVAVPGTEGTVERSNSQNLQGPGSKEMVAWQ